ncbi:hypothetical protein ABGB07_27990 [Micromonosporaceae bacterium B7E4]
MRSGKQFSEFGDLPGEFLVAAVRRFKAADQAGFARALAGGDGDAGGSGSFISLA